MRPLLIGTMIFSLTVLPVPTAFAGSGNKLALQNVELNAAGQVNGQLLDIAGKPIAGQMIEIRTSDNAVKVKTSPEGRFVVTSDHGSNVAIMIGDRAYAARLWKHGTAPPRSLKSFGIKHTQGPIIRAQDCECDDEGYGFLGGVSGAQLLGLGLLAGAVVAIVLAVEDDDDGS